ncbi:MAG: type II secretion system protein [bacterium]
MKRQKGFTLIELMIVVAIIGILAAIAVPKFVDLVGRAKDAATYGNLGALRSAITLYYAEKEEWPGEAVAENDAILATELTPDYIARIPEAKLGNSGCDATDLESDVVDAVKVAADVSLVPASVTNAGGWLYNQTTGEIVINSTCLESKDGGEEYYKK